MPSDVKTPIGQLKQPFCLAIADSVLWVLARK
jgi:hypothetical protein